jgi:hypothetical protein
VFEEEQEIGYAPGPALFDERALHVAGNGVRDDAQPADLELAHALYGSASDRGRWSAR